MSSIVVVYGYAFDQKDRLTHKEREEIYDWIEENDLYGTDGVRMTTSYTVGAANVTAFTIGVVIQDFGMFWPEKLSKVFSKTVAKKAKKALANYTLPKLPKGIIQLNKKPQLMVFGHNDD